MSKKGQKSAVQRMAQKTGNVRQMNSQQKMEQKKQAEQLQQMIVSRMIEMKKTLFAILTKLNISRGTGFIVEKTQLMFFYTEIHKSDDVKHFSQYEKIDQRVQLLNHMVANFTPNLICTDAELMAEVWKRYEIMSE